MKITSILLLAFAAIFLVSCSGSTEVKTRKDQEAEFAKVFGFTPPPTIASIKYADLYNRGVMDGAYGQWMSFTYEEETYQKIVERGYTPTSSNTFPNSEASPAWWPATVTEGTTLFSRTHDDTPADEGFSFEEYLWYDEPTGQVFFHKFYWD